MNRTLLHGGHYSRPACLKCDGTQLLFEVNSEKYTRYEEARANHWRCDKCEDEPD